MLGHAFSISLGYLQLCLALHFLLVQKLKAVRGEGLGPSQVIHNLADTQPCTCMLFSRVLGMYGRFSKSPIDIPYPSFSF